MTWTGSAARLCGGLLAASLSCGVLSGCGHHDSSPAATGSTGTISPSTSPSPSPSHDGKPTKHHRKVKARDFPLAPSTYTPVVRNGKTPHPSISAAPEPFSQSVTYSDGVRLVVTGIHHGRVGGEGPGVVAGPKTTFDLRFVNGSHRAISLDQVVPTVTFGKPARTARPVYDDKTQDFGATVQPGGSATAIYAFSIPVAELSDVTVHLDFDGQHYAATFQGSASH